MISIAAFPLPPNNYTPAIPSLHITRTAVDCLQVDGHPGGPKYVHFRRYRELHGLLQAFVSMQERAYAPDQIGPIVPRLLNLVSGSVRPYFFFFEDERERAVARLAARSEQVEPARTPGGGGGIGER